LLPNIFDAKGAQKRNIANLLDLFDLFGICLKPNGLRYLRVGGRGFCLGAEKTRSQKMLENAAESPASGAPGKSGAHFSGQKPSS